MPGAPSQRALISNPISAVSTALRLGESAGAFWTLYDTWTPDLELRLQQEWEALRPDVKWDMARPIVRQGWELCRRNAEARREAEARRGGT